MPVAVYAHQLRDIARRLPSEKAARTAAARAINRALDSGRTEAARTLHRNYTIKQRRVSAKITTSRATPSKLMAGVTWRGWALNLNEFSVTPGKPAPAKRPKLYATIARGSGKKHFDKAFLITTRSGKTLAFRRTSLARDSGERYPITGVWGPSIPQLLGSKTVREAVEARALAVLDQRIEHEIDRALRSGK